MAQSPLPRDPLAAHEVVRQRAEQEFDRRRDERRKPLPEQSLAMVCFVSRPALACIQVEVLDVSSGGMRLAAFAHEPIVQGDRCEIQMEGDSLGPPRWATVRWVKSHPLIQCFGVEFDAR